MVLILDDNLFFASKIYGQLRKEGIECRVVSHFAESGLSGLLRESELVIINLNAREVDFLKVIAQINSSTSLKILGFCGHGETQLKQKAEEAGCDWVVPNSVVTNKLVRFLKQKNLVSSRIISQTQKP